jgi:hypothetical protein
MLLLNTYLSVVVLVLGVVTVAIVVAVAVLEGFLLGQQRYL